MGRTDGAVVRLDVSKTDRFLVSTVAHLHTVGPEETEYQLVIQRKPFVRCRHRYGTAPHTLFMSLFALETVATPKKLKAKTR